jgi:diketogulonate reductase-like aldo/keto reductase
MIVLPRSSNLDHIKENMECLNIGLNENVMNILNGLDSNYCLYPRF